MLFHVTIFGHSYVKDLANLGKFDILIENNTFFLKFLPFPGATFCTFIDNPALFERIKETNPDFVIVILGGNDLKANIELSHIYDRCKSFYTTLRSYLPNSWIIASQIENRFYHPQNRFGSPPSGDFDFLRSHFNQFLKKKAFKDFLLRVQGPNRLDGEENYRDSVHLNAVGLSKYFSYIECTLSYAYIKKFGNK